MPSFDRAAAKAAGYSDAEIDSFLAKRPALPDSGRASAARVLSLGAPGPASAAPLPPFEQGAMLDAMRPEGTYGPDAREKDYVTPTPQAVFGAALPTALATAGTMLIPEAAPVAWLLRMLTAGGLGTAGEFGAQKIRGEQTNVPGALLRGGLELGGQGVGELASPLVKLGAHGLMKSALNVNKGTTEEAARIVGQQTKQLAAPSDVDLAQQAIDKRVSPGKALFNERGPYPGSGYKKIKGEQDAIAAERSTLLGNFKKQGHHATVNDLTKYYPEARADFATSKDPKDRLWFEKRIQTFFNENTKLVKGKGGRVFRKPTDIPPDELADLVTTWSTEAEKVLKDPHAIPSKTREATFKKYVAKAGREWLRDLTPSAVKGGIGRIEELNRAYQANIPLETALWDAELPRGVSGGLKDMNPLHAISPSVRGRAALALTEPALHGPLGLRSAPRHIPASVYALIELMRGRAGADTTGVSP